MDLNKLYKEIEEAFVLHIRHILPSLRAAPLRMFLFSYLSFYHLQLSLLRSTNVSYISE